MIDPGHDRRLVVSPAIHVSTGYDGVLAEELVHEGDLVDAGDPLARPYPEVPA